jgi:hypothetical protein
VVREFRYSPSKLTQVLEFDDPELLREKLLKYIETGLVVYAQPDFIYEINAVPNDPWYASFPGPQWSLPIISAPLAWGMFLPAPVGDSSVIIAVGDTGANVLHPDLSTNMVDPSLHHNFISGGNNVDDDYVPYYHGSATASIIGAQGDNAYDMTGVAWDTSLMILKVVDSAGFASNTNVSDAVKYAADHGATAINLSLGGYDAECEQQQKPPYFYVCEEGYYDKNLFDALQYARNHNMVVVSSAGNGALEQRPYDFDPNNDLNLSRLSPASIPTDNNISVMATNRSDVRASYSSYGKYRVDLAAPGGEGSDYIPALRQTFHTPSISADCNQGFTGTSAAAPHVTGALALIKSKYPWENYAGIRDRLLMGVDPIPGASPGVEGKCRTNGRLNIFKALQPRSMLRNLSTRARVEGGDKVMIAGFIIGGSAGGGSIEVVMRGLGPSVGVSPSLGNPVIELHYPDNHVETNDDWASDIRHNDLAATGLAPSNSSEAAMIRLLAPGAYTVIVRDAGTAYGIGLVELYALGNSEQSRLQNISTRCLVGTGNNVAIAGTIIGGNIINSPAPRPNRRLLIFGKGPSIPLNVLDTPGPSPLLLNPQIQITGGESNDDWQTIDNDSGDGDALEEKLEEAQRAPTNIFESALWPTFTPGAYTVVLSGVNQTAGIGLLEFYEY